MPRISLVIPAWNENAYLPRLLDSVELARERYSEGASAIEVIVADNLSTDATAEIAARRHCRVVRVEKRVIAAARNGGAAIATGELLCFVDADMRIHPETFNELDAVMKSGRFVAGASGVRLERLSLGIVVTWCLMMPMVVLFKMDTGVVFCRREDFLAVGGYNEDRFFAEDVDFLMKLRAHGMRSGRKLVRLRRSKAIASTRKFDKHGDWHYLTNLLRLVPLMVRSPTATTEWARKYWYEDER